MCMYIHLKSKNKKIIIKSSWGVRDSTERPKLHINNKKIPCNLRSQKTSNSQFFFFLYIPYSPKHLRIMSKILVEKLLKITFCDQTLYITDAKL